MLIRTELLLLMIYLIDAINTILASLSDNRKYYSVCKSLLMPLLLASYLVAIPDEVLTQPYQKFMILAFICHSQGDIFLLFPKNKTRIYFYIGTLSFFAGHILNTIWFSQPFWTKFSSFTFAAIVVVVTVEILLGKQMIGRNKKLGFALLCYTFSLGVLGVAVASVKSVAAMIGIVAFWISDYTIARRELKMKTSNNTVTISTYIVAQSLIVLGMYMMQI